MSTFSSCATVPPQPAEKPHQLEAHGHKRNDPWFWMKDRENPDVIAHLNRENEYLEKVLEPVKELREKVLGELKARVKQDDETYPFHLRGFHYYKRFEPGKEYPIYARRKGSPTAPEEILLDVNQLAVGKEYTSVPFPEVSPDNTKLIYAADFQGRRFYDLYVMDIATKKLIGKPIEKTTGNAEWANDSQTFFYVKQHPDTLRSQWVFRAEVGGDKGEMIFEEKDETFGVAVSRSRTDDFLFLASYSTLSNEWRFLDANRPKGEFEVFAAREKKHEYSLEDGGDAFYVVTNWNAKNFRLMRAPRAATPKEKWVEVVKHRKDVLLEDATFFRSHYVLSERKDGQTVLSVTDRKTKRTAPIAFPDPVFVASVETNPEFDVGFLRYRYESLNRPHSIYDYDFRTAKSTLRKQQEVPTFDASLYESERVWATARDGVKVPVSLVYRKGFRKDGSNPMLVYGYGSYGASMEPWFQRDIVSLLDRGFVYAMAHIRGGSEMGRHWYDDGKLLKKMNTFTDFIDVTEHLLKERYADPKRVYAEGASAGGLLMGAIVNLRPDLYRGINAGVPFVDVLTTMLDDSIPLTTSEYDEWGDPRKKEYYDYMAAYSPYDNVKAQAYPHILITSGLHDSQVQYWEPTKWAAKLRKLRQGDSLVLLFTEMDAGHGGASGRFEALKQTALEYSFYLLLDGHKE